MRKGARMIRERKLRKKMQAKSKRGINEDRKP
jgi:hypothetical protein